MITEVLPLSPDGRVTLTTYLHAPSPELPLWERRPAVVVFPGGGYNFLSDREAEPIALAFLAQGFHTFVLRYSVAEHAAFPNSLCDASRALALIRARAAEWGVEPGKIAVCGFSAGGHLAASLGTLWNDPEIVAQSGVTDGTNRPNALVLAYPVITAGPYTHEGIAQGPFAHPGSIQTLCAGRRREELDPRLSCELNVGPHTPPAFLFHTVADELVPVQNALLFANALAKAAVPFELHIWPSGPHGLALSNRLTGMGEDIMIDPDVEQWFGLCVKWLWKVFGKD
jgi:acetyl esterase/lipase